MKPFEGSKLKASSLLLKKEVDLIINIPKTKGLKQQRSERFEIRRLAIDPMIHLLTNFRLPALFLKCLPELNTQHLPINFLRKMSNKIMARIGWKNRLVTLLVKILKRRNDQPREGAPRRILIVSTTALGDTLWATPSIANVRASFPEAYLAILTSPIGKQVLLHDPRLDAIHVLREPLLRHFPSLLRLLRKERFDAALLLHASQRLILPLLTLSNIPVIIGSAEKNKGFDHLLTTALPRLYEHEIERRARIVRSLGAATAADTLSYTLLPEETLAAQQLLGPKVRPRIALHLGARELFRRFPLKSFIALGKLLFRYDLFLTGTQEEEPLLKQVREELPHARILLHPFRTFAALLNEMDLILSTDTGPLHLSCALNKPLLALFASSDPLLFGPHKAPRAHVLARPATCSPCLKRGCHEPFCFLQFSPHEIAALIERICPASL